MEHELPSLSQNIPILIGARRYAYGCADAADAHAATATQGSSEGQMPRAICEITAGCLLRTVGSRVPCDGTDGRFSGGRPRLNLDRLVDVEVRLAWLPLEGELPHLHAHT